MLLFEEGRRVLRLAVAEVKGYALRWLLFVKRKVVWTVKAGRVFIVSAKFKLVERMLSY